MLHLLKIEWLKIKNYKPFYLMTGLIAGLMIIVSYYIKSTVEELNNMSSVGIFDESYTFPGIWKTIGYHYSWMILLSVVVIINNITNEISFKTLRQNIIDGLSRQDFLLSKILFVFMMSLFFTLCYILTCLILGLPNGIVGMFEDIQYVLYVFASTLCLFSVTFLFALYIKKSSLTIILFLAYLLIENGISSYINFKTGTSYGNFLPLQCGDALLPSATLEKVKKLTNMGSNDIAQPIYAMACIGYSIICFFVAKIKLEKSDL